MPTRRTPKRRGERSRRITPAAIAAWQTGDWMGLYRALDLRPWMPHPFDISENETPAENDTTEWAACFPEILDLRLELTRLAGEPPTQKET
jgi:hypothetical protein